MMHLLAVLDAENIGRRIPGHFAVVVVAIQAIYSNTGTRVIGALLSHEIDFYLSDPCTYLFPYHH